MHHTPTAHMHSCTPCAIAHSPSMSSEARTGRFRSAGASAFAPTLPTPLPAMIFWRRHQAPPPHSYACRVMPHLPTPCSCTPTPSSHASPVHSQLISSVMRPVRLCRAGASALAPSGPKSLPATRLQRQHRVALAHSHACSLAPHMPTSHAAPLHRPPMALPIRVGVRGGAGDYFLRLYTPFAILGLARQAYSVIVNHETGRILIGSSLSSQSPDFVTMHGQAALSVFG